MAKKDSRTALRLPKAERQKIDDLIMQGRFKTKSQVIRTAIEEFLKTS